MQAQDWTKVLKIRPEVIASDGGVGDLQMSLHRAVYQTSKVPYQDVGYYGDITEPTPNLVGFFARLARRLSAANETFALYHLDQGMGGGKSHALVGLYHMANNPKLFFQTHIGKEVFSEAKAGGSNIEFSDVRIVTLTADHFSPGKSTETFGPATNLFERFLWSLFKGDRAKYETAVALGANKTTIQKALSIVGVPVLILLDELMDYGMALSGAESIGSMPSEQAFLNALMDACDDVPRVAFVLVMIRSELDPEGYTPAADSFREYLSKRINRNGATIAVTETGDFAAILRRRIFEQAEFDKAAAEVASAFKKSAAKDAAWGSQVFDRLGPGKSMATFASRISETYPFHPDLMDLVQDEWGKTQGFQRVRSTVSIFALAALHWSRSAAERSWVPILIGVGDLPIGGINGGGKIPQSRCLEAILNSGLLLGNDRAIQGYRAVATTDVTSADGTSGQAVKIDQNLAASNVDVGQPLPAVRMATALFNYSLVARSQGKRGATKPELLAAILTPLGGASCAFAAAEEVFNALTAADGLGALEASQSANNQANRFWLTIKQTLRMFFNSARNQVHETEGLLLAWEIAQNLASKGQFDKICAVQMPSENQDLSAVAGGFDAQENRLLILDLRNWTLLDGEDSKTREDIRRILGAGDNALVVDNAASCVVAIVNSYQRRHAVQASQDVLTWKLVAEQAIDGDESGEILAKLADAREKLKEKVLKAYRHYAYVIRKGDTLEVTFPKLEDDRQCTLLGNDVWTALVNANRAVGEYFDPIEKRRKRKVLSEEYVAMLLAGFNRHLTLRDVVSSFYNNPRFPLVPTVDDIRGVIFDLLNEPDHAGAGTGGWELVAADGSILQVDDPKQIAINSLQIQIRKRQARSSSEVDPEASHESPTLDLAHGDGETARSASDNALETTRTTEDANTGTMKTTPNAYSWYGVEVNNRSITDDSKREEIQKHLRWLISKLDNEELRHQLISIRYELMAASNKDLASDVENRANAIQAKFTVRDET